MFGWLLVERVASHERIVRRRLWPFGKCVRPRRYSYPIFPFLEDAAFRLAIRGENRICHATYFGLPRNWQGQTVESVYDMLSERYPDMFSGGESDQLRARKRETIERVDVVVCISETTKADVLEMVSGSAVVR